jgi:ribosome-associated heat shock protein Hsp15
MAQPPERQRIDKWLWAARFFKTRALAAQEIGRGRVQIMGAMGGSAVKAAREIKPGDMLRLRQEQTVRTVRVQALSALRGPAPGAQQLYEETAESLAERERAAAARRLAPEPAAALPCGRPTKRERRALDHTRRDWDARWSAGLPPE